MTAEELHQLYVETEAQLKYWQDQRQEELRYRQALVEEQIGLANKIYEISKKLDGLDDQMETAEDRLVQSTKAYLANLKPQEHPFR